MKTPRQSTGAGVVVVVGDVVRLSPYAPADLATLDLDDFHPLSPPRAPHA